MKSHRPSNGKRPEAGPGPRAPYVVAASVFVAAWLSSIVFVSLYRAPAPADAFAALGARIASTAGGGSETS